MIEGNRWRQISPFLVRNTVSFLILAGLYWAHLVNFLLFHTLAELIAILIAFSIFVMAWNARSYLNNQAILFLGIAYLYVGLFDLLHALAYQGMGVFPIQDANLATQLWLVARFLQTVSLLTAPIFFRRSFQPRLMMALMATISAALLGSIFYWKIFPTAYIPVIGLTRFKIYSEYIFCILLAAALLIWIRKGRQVDPGVAYWFAASIGLTIASEVIFTFYITLTDTWVVIGHMLKIIAFYLVYRTVIETGLQRPFQLLFRDIQQSRDALLKERNFISAILNTSNILVLVMEANGRIVQVNRAFEEASGFYAVEVIDRYIWEMGIFPVTQDQFKSFFRQQKLDPPIFEGESRIITKEQNTREVTWSSSSFTGSDDGKRYLITTGIDITEQKQVQTELIYLSTHDVLTGLYNRAFFETEMVRLAGTDHFPTSMVMMDLDGLKTVNDTYGHQTGDRLIQEAAEVIKSAFRDEDVIARMGGDEFAVLLPGADEVIADQARRRIRSLLKAYNQKHSDLPLSLSFGSSTAIAGYMLVETLKHADHEMYQDKVAHKERIKLTSSNVPHVP